MSEPVFDVRERLKWMLDENTCNISQSAAEGARGALEILDYKDKEIASLKKQLDLYKGALQRSMTDGSRKFDLIEQQGKELNKLRETIDRVSKESDQWHREAVKANAELGEIKIFNVPQPIENWSEDDGNCLWYKFPIEEPPYCGTPLDSEWEENDYDDYYTHFTRLTIPQKGSESHED